MVSAKPELLWKPELQGTSAEFPRFIHLECSLIFKYQTWKLKEL